MTEVDPWLRDLVTQMHRDIVDTVREDLRTTSSALLSSEARAGAGDVTFHIDVRPEQIVERTFSRAPEPVIVVCEGLGRVVLPASGAESDASWCVIVDPLDGSREISYGKRSAWVLTAVAPAHPRPTLRDTLWALQTEIPPLFQHRSIALSADRTGPVICTARDLANASSARPADDVSPSDASSIGGGYAVFVDYFAGIHEITGRLADSVFVDVLGGVAAGAALVFNDQYLSTAGCMYLLATGKYRFCADLRPIVWRAARGEEAPGLCAHPYDLCTALIAERAGVIVTDPSGAPLSYPLATDVDCGWVGYANGQIRAEVEPALQRALSDLTRIVPAPGAG